MLTEKFKIAGYFSIQNSSLILDSINKCNSLLLGKGDMGEIYIPIPAEIHNQFPDFFPSRDVHFDLTIPTGQTFKAKVCQDNSKALMTDPNKAMSD